MKTLTLRLGLSLMVMLGFWANRLPAQTVVNGPEGEHILIVPTAPYEPAHISPNPNPLTPPPLPAKHRAQHLMNQHGMGCQSNSPWGACGNLHYDLNFIFGSCRSFFGERCDPNQHGADKRNQR